MKARIKEMIIQVILVIIEQVAVSVILYYLF